MIPTYFWHGGIAGLRAGDLITPGHERPALDGCPICTARAAGKTAVINGHPIDGPSQHPDRVYVTTHRLYARHYASLWGYGDLYRVEAVGKVARSGEDSFDTWTCEAARVVGVHDRAVLLTMAERRRLYREWSAADQVARVHRELAGGTP